MGNSLKSAQYLIDSRMMEAANGCSEACHDLGIFYSSGAEATDIDLIEAHKWFNIAAMRGNERAQECRAEISEDMTAREIAEAQKQARAWLQMTISRAA